MTTNTPYGKDTSVFLPSCWKCGWGIIPVAEELSAHGQRCDGLQADPRRVAEQVMQPEPATTARYIEMTIRKRELDAASRKLGEELDRMEAVLLDQWIEVGRQSERLDGVTVYIAARTWATPKDGDRAAVVAALEALGMRDMVTYNTQTLSAWFKERAEAEQEVPATLAEVVSLETKHSLNVRKGK